MNVSAHFPDSDCELFLTAGKNASIGAALPRSSNGKTTDSDSVAETPKSSIVRSPAPFCSPRASAAHGVECELSNAEIIAELTRVKCEFQLRTICAVMGVKR